MAVGGRKPKELVQSLALAPELALELVWLKKKKPNEINVWP